MHLKTNYAANPSANFLRQFFCNLAAQTSFMRILVILFLIYILFQVVFRFILPLAARYMFQKAAQNMQGQFRQQQQQQQAPPRREGEVRIETPGSNARKSGADDGEFVDFTEIK